MTVTVPWSQSQVDYVAALLHDRAKGKVEMAAIFKGGSVIKDLRSDLAADAITIEGMATDLEGAVVTDERGEDDLAEDSTDGHGPDDSPDSGGGDA